MLLLELALEKESDQHLNAYRPGGGGSLCSVHPRVTPGVLGGSVCGGLQGLNQFF